MKTEVVNVVAFVTDEIIRKGLIRAAELRRKTLDACYMIPGYEDLPHKEKRKIYDTIFSIFNGTEE